MTFASTREAADPVAVDRLLPGTRRWRKSLVALARCLLGGMYLAGGLVPFLHWADLPMPSPEAGQFLVTLVDSDMLKVSKTLEVVFGITLLLNLWVPLSLAMLAPVLFFIGWVDLYIDPFPEGVAAVSLMLICHLGLMAVHWRCYRPMFVRRPAP